MTFTRYLHRHVADSYLHYFSYVTGTHRRTR